MKYLSASSSSSLLIWYTHSVLKNGWIYFRCSIQCTIFLGCHPRPEPGIYPEKRNLIIHAECDFGDTFVHMIYIYILALPWFRILFVFNATSYGYQHRVSKAIYRAVLLYICVYIYIWIGYLWWFSIRSVPGIDDGKHSVRYTNIKQLFIVIGLSSTLAWIPLCVSDWKIHTPNTHTYTLHIIMYK